VDVGARKRCGGLRLPHGTDDGSFLLPPLRNPCRASGL
jgi:hypothetical protein